jgi:hypothetical protein
MSAISVLYCSAYALGGVLSTGSFLSHENKERVVIVTIK